MCSLAKDSIREIQRFGKFTAAKTRKASDEMYRRSVASNFML